MKNQWIEQANKNIAHTYNRPPVIFSKGEGCYLWDTEGNKYTDFIAGIAVCNLGHAHPQIVRALKTQAENLWHVSNLYYSLPQIELAQWLTNNSFADRVFFCNSGAEANEAAIKLTRRYFHSKGLNHRYKIIAMDQSFHGRTMATLSATGQAKVKIGYEPILEGFDFVPYNDIASLKSKIDDQTAGIILEPIQGEGGVIPATQEFMDAVAAVCEDTGTLLIYDEIQTGIGRTGKMFAYEHYSVKPHIMTLAKALANGLPIGAMLATEEIAAAFEPGAHASTFGGTPLVSATALEVLKTIEKDELLAHCQSMGEYFKKELIKFAQKQSVIKEMRCIGLLIGVELAIEGAPIVEACLKKGFLINCIQGNIIRFAPPLVIQKQDIDDLLACIDEILENV